MARRSVAPVLPSDVSLGDARWVAAQFLDGIGIDALARRMYWSSFTVEQVLRATLHFRRLERAGGR